MIELLKRFQMSARRLINLIGYDVRRVPRQHGIDQYYNLYGTDAVENRRFYNVGAGAFRHRAWTNIDHESDWYRRAQGSSIGIDWDLLSLSPLPLEDGRAEVIYSSHTIEHITDDAAKNMLKESHRVLKTDGILRIVTPDIDLVFRAYSNGDRDYFYWADRYHKPKNYRSIGLSEPLNKASIQQLFLWDFAAHVSTLHAGSPCERITDKELDRRFTEMKYEDALNYFTSKCSPELQKQYPGNHINWWNENKLIRMLRAAGFSKVYPSGYGQSSCPPLRDTVMFDNTHPKRSLYVEAKK